MQSYGVYYTHSAGNEAPLRIGVTIMKIKTLTGHLTALDKKAIDWMFKNNETSASSKKKQFSLLEIEKSVYKLIVNYNEKDMWNNMVQRKEIVKFEVA